MIELFISLEQVEQTEHKKWLGRLPSHFYGFKLSAEQISKITDYVLEEQENWQNRTLAPFYPFRRLLFV